MKLKFLLFTIFILFTIQEEKGYVSPKHSFQAPFLFGITSSLPYFEYGGSSLITEHFIRLTPAVKSRVGYLWNTDPVEAKNWNVELSLNIHNTEMIGADGLAFWYTKESKREGPLFGNQENFDGVGIILDSFDNNGDGNEPAIIIVKNNGEHKKWDYANDLRENQIDRCRVDYRRTGSDSTQFKLKITYEAETLSVFYDTYGNGNYLLCTSVNNLKLPKGYHFGLTALTGGLADYHDVYSMTTRLLDVSAEPEETGIKKGYWDPLEYYQLFEKEKIQKEKEQKEREEKEEKERMKKITEEFENRRMKYEQEQHQRFDQYRDKVNKFDDQKPEERKKVSQVILEALEDIGKNIQSSSTKTDTNYILERIQQMFDHSINSHTTILDLKTQIHNEVTSMIEGIKKETSTLVQDIKRLENVLNHLTEHISSISQNQLRVSSELSQHHEKVKETIQTHSTSGSSGLGFWMYFLLFQIVFAAAYVYYQKFKEIKNQKVF